MHDGDMAPKCQGASMHQAGNWVLGPTLNLGDQVRDVIILPTGRSGSYACC